MLLSNEQIFQRLQEYSFAASDSGEKSELSFDRLLCVESPEAFVFETYRLVLRREPTPVEVETHVGTLRKGANRRLILSNFASSPEARRLGTRCPIYWSEQRIQQLIDLPLAKFLPAVYRSFLWRHPGGPEEQPYLQLLERGVPRAYIIFLICSSVEGQKFGSRLPSSWIPKDAAQLLVVPETQFLRESFRAYLWREPKADELSAFGQALERGVPRRHILFQLFKASTELGMTGRFPADWLPKTHDELQTIPEADFVRAAYRSYLWRDPDATEAKSYSELFQRGTPRTSLLNRIARSDEARRIGIEFPREWIPRSMDQLLDLPDDEGFLRAAYQSLLWRAPDPDGLASWSAKLASGIPRAFILYQIAGSEEGRKAGARFPDEWIPKSAEELLQLPAGDFLTAAYRSILWRAPDGNARRYETELSWGRSRASVLRELTSSDRALRIPYRIAGLDSLQEPAPRLLWLLRKRLYRSMSAMFGLDNRFEVLEESLQQSSSAMQRGILKLEQQLENQKTVLTGVAERALEKLHSASSQREDRISGLLREQQHSIAHLEWLVSTLRSDLEGLRPSENRLAGIEAIEQSVQELQKALTALVNRSPSQDLKDREDCPVA